MTLKTRSSNGGFVIAPHGRRNLIEETLLISATLSIATMLIVLGLFFAVAGQIALANLRSQAAATADEIADILIEPLYTVDDNQAARIAAALVASGRISGLRLESKVTGVLFEQVAEREPRWVPALTRRIDRGDLYLGDVRLVANEAEMDATLSRYLLAVGLLAATMVLASAASNLLFIRKRVRSSFDRLEEGIRQIELGSLGYEIPPSGYRDLDRLVLSFNKMSASVEDSRAQLSRLNAELEERVRVRTAELEAALAEQRSLRDQLVESAKLSALGQLSAGIAHEINTPLGAIISSNGYLLDFLETDYRAQLESFADSSARDRDTYWKLLDMGIEANRNVSLNVVSRAEKRSVAEALAAAGITEADEVADELCDMALQRARKEIAAALGDADGPLDLTRRAAGALHAYRMIRVIEESGVKAASVVSALRSYLHPAAESAKVVDVHEEIGKALTLMHNSIKYGVELRTELASGRPMAVADRLDQVLVNLIRNAAQAMGFKGGLTIRTRETDTRVVVSVIDSGSGIPPELREKIWKPFFTTRDNGEGIGLGLDISRRLVERYGGRLYFESEPGHTEFHVDLPRGAAAG